MIEALLGQIRNTALIVGTIAFIGLLLQKKKSSEVISGTMKTIIGFMIFSIGSSSLGAIVNNFTKLFNTGFSIAGVTTQVEVATALALDTYGTVVALVLVLGFIVNLLVAKFTPFKAIFLTGQHFLYFACVLALVLVAGGLNEFVVVIVGGILLGLAGAILPTLCQPFMNKLTGSDDIAMGHFNCIGYAFSGYVGKFVGKISNVKENDSENIKLPGFLSLFRDFIFSVAVFMVVLFYVAVIACVVNGHMDVVKELAKNDIYGLFILYFKDCNLQQV